MLPAQTEVSARTARGSLVLEEEGTRREIGGRSERDGNRARERTKFRLREGIKRVDGRTRTKGTVVKEDRESIRQATWSRMGDASI